MNKIQNMTKLNKMKFLPKHASKFSLLAAALYLSGCTLAPNYEQPELPVAQEWPDMQLDVLGQEHEGLVAGELPWQQFFGDKRLVSLIELALENNRDMQIAVLNIERARAQYQIQRSELLPSVGINAGINRTSTSGESANARGSSTNVYSTGIGITSYELDLFGRVRSLSQTAQASYMATIEARKATQISLIASVATGYYVLLADDQLISLTEETLQTREESLKLTRLMFDNGVASELDVSQAETLVESARSSLAQLRRQRAQDENAFVLLIGGPIPQDLPQGASFAEQGELMPNLSSGIPSEIMARRPDILAAEQQIVAANGSIGAARAAFFPSISLTGILGKASNDLDDLFNSGHFWSFTPQITLPIFTGGRNTAGLEVARADQHIAIAQYEKAIQSAFREVSDALAGRATYSDQLIAMSALVASSQKAYELSDLRYRNGVSSFLDLLDSQRMLYDAQQQQILAQLAMLSNQVTLYKVLGGGWSDLDEQNAQQDMRETQARVQMTETEN